MSEQPIGLFGGSFDPPHLGHLAMAQAALQELGLSAVRWIPAGAAWQKKRSLSDAAHRQAMVQATIAGQAGMQLDTTELNRAGPSYTIDTVRALRRAHPGQAYALILGEDQWRNLPTWHQADELLATVKVVVARRLASDSTLATAGVAPTPWRVLAWSGLPVSSTDIRARVARGADIGGLVAPEVARYIALHGLYQSPCGIDHTV